MILIPRPSIRAVRKAVLLPCVQGASYLIIRNFIESDRAKQLSKDFKEECKKENAVGDSLVLDCQGMYNYMPFLEFV